MLKYCSKMKGNRSQICIIVADRSAGQSLFVNGAFVMSTNTGDAQALTGGAVSVYRVNGYDESFKIMGAMVDYERIVH